MVNDDGSQIVLPDGKPLMVQFAPGEFSIDPFEEPKQIDFATTTGGISEGIYRWEGAKLRIK